jgi:hypothetical protein
MGILDFATFDCEQDTHLTLHLARTRLYHTANPICVLANYIFDTLRHDAFRVVDGALHEALLTVTTDTAVEPDLNDPALIARFKQKWTYQKCDPNTYYDGYVFVSLFLYCFSFVRVRK